MFLKKRNSIIFWLLMICTMLMNNSFAQINKNAIKSNINNYLKSVYNGYYEVNTIIKLDDHLGDMRYYDLPTEDPYTTLKHCYFFVAEAISGPENLGNIVGMYKSGNVLWYSDQNEIGIEGFYSLLTTRDINNDGKVDILITSGNGIELWIYSWDGSSGQRINDKDGWTSVIQGEQGSFTIFDAEGDGIWEIRSLAHRDGSKSWSWNGHLYGKWPNTSKIPDTAWLPRNNVSVNINCKITKQDSTFTYTYTVHSNSASKQRINYFSVECKTSNLVKSQPEGWDSRGNWVWDQDGWGTQVYYWHKPKEIMPGKTLYGFKIETSAIPFISLFVVRGENMLPLTINYSSKQDSIDFVNNSVIGFSIGPSNPPSPFIPLKFIDSLISYKHRALSLGWIENQGIVNSLDSKLNNAKKMLAAGNIKVAKNELNAFVNEVEAQKGKHLTSEAYALLKYNAEYLIKELK